jgi:hypothetical protein
VFVYVFLSLRLLFYLFLSSRPLGRSVCSACFLLSKFSSLFLLICQSSIRSHSLARSCSFFPFSLSSLAFFPSLSPSLIILYPSVPCSCPEDLAEAKAELKAVKAELKAAKAELKAAKAEDPPNQPAVAKAELAVAEAKLAVAKAELAVAEAKLPPNPELIDALTAAVISGQKVVTAMQTQQGLLTRMSCGSRRFSMSALVCISSGKHGFQSSCFR